MGFNKHSLLLVALLMAGCQTIPVAPVVSLSTPVPTPASSPSAETTGTGVSVSPSASPSPLATDSPTPTPTPTATAAPASSGGGGSRNRELAAGDYMFVLNGLGKTIDRVSLDTGTVTKSVLSTGLFPNQLHRAGDETYLVNSGDADIFKLNLLTPRKLDTIDLAIASNPFTMYPLPASQTETFIVNYMDSDGDVARLADVSFLDLSTKTVDAAKTVNLPTGSPAGGALIHDGKAYVPAIAATYGGKETNYAATYTFSGVYVIDLEDHTLVKTIAFAHEANPGSIELDPASGLIHVCINTGIALIDPETNTVVSGGLVSAVPLHSVRFVSETLAYAAVYDGLVTFNPATQAFIKGPEQKIAAGGDTSVGDFTIRDGKAYVPNFANDTVTVVNLATDTVEGTPFRVGDGPQAVVFQTKAP